VGLIGCGGISRVHLRHLRRVPGVRIVGLCDTDLDRARALRREIREGEAFRTVDDLLGVGLDAVHVLTPPETHADVAVAALEGGAHVLVEKPMAASLDGARRMRAAAAAARRVLCVDHNRLFDPAVVAARERLAAGAIGTLVSVEALQGVNLRESGAAPTPFSMWLNLGPHPLSLIRDFAGDILESHACAGPHGELRAVVKGSRALGSLVFSPATTPYLNMLLVHGTAGTLHLDLNTMTLVRRRERRLPSFAAKAALNVDHALQLLSGTGRTMLQVATRRLGTYPGMGVVVARFYDAVRSGAAPPVTAVDGEAIVELLETLWRDGTAPRAEAASRRRWNSNWLAGRNDPAVLVTGASGFLGRRVVTELHRRGWRVRAMVRTDSPPQWDGVEIAHAALGDTRAVARAVTGVRAVVHCAARVARAGTRAEFFRDNVTGTAHLLEAAAAAGVERFVHVSSIGIYGQTTAGNLVRENGGYDPHPELRGAYTWSKLAADRLVGDFGRTHGLRTVIVRPGILVGPDGPRFTARLTIGPLAGRLWIVGHRTAVLPLCHVEDAARGIAAAVERPEARGAYNLVDESLTQEEWLRAGRDNGASVRATYLPPALLTLPAAGLELVAKLARRPAPTLSRYKIRRATERLHYDTSRARHDLGWTPEVGVRALALG
jgi:nucleoside-diphosphate-sugar epimerase/predicted dehydrogenase